MDITQWFAQFLVGIALFKWGQFDGRNNPRRKATPKSLTLTSRNAKDPSVIDVKLETREVRGKMQGILTLNGVRTEIHPSHTILDTPYSAIKCDGCGYGPFNKPEFLPFICPGVHEETTKE